MTRSKKAAAATHRSSSSGENRAAILDAAERLFATHGFAATSVRDIVQGAGITAPMLYYYFGSKDELFNTLVRERFADLRVQGAEELRELGSTGEILAVWTRRFLQMAALRPNTVRFLFAAIFGPRAGLPPLAILQCGEELRMALASALLRVEPGLLPERLLFTLMMLFGAINHFILPYMDGLIAGPPDEIATAIASRMDRILHDDLPLPTQLCGLDGVYTQTERE